jgi:protein transport protein SEC23
MAVYRSFIEDAFDVVRWIDRALIRVVQKFGDYRKDDPTSLRMSPEFSIFPQFIFHLRRCALLQVFNSSPDETALYREVFFRENCTNCMKIIQPTLLSYSLTDPPMPALLDATSVLPDHVLILDSFFEVVVFIGETIASWREAGYHMKEEYKNLKDLLEVPVTHARDIEKKRFPSPRFIICDQHSSESRLLLSRVNPSVTHQTMGSGVQGDVVFTEDVSLQVFMEHLRRLATQS